VVVHFADCDFVFDLTNEEVCPSHFDVVVDNVDAVNPEVAFQCQVDSDVSHATAGVEDL